MINKLYKSFQVSINTRFFMTNRNSRMKKEKKQLETDIDSGFYSQREYKKESSKGRSIGEKKAKNLKN
ncbi:hypothetical protein NEQG_01401 [Nematocida parisii ERTm3]|uniref:Uncharacterized protein n=1 Tax=Nematocida parisii (strain ERTm3) TaxID=935791 RepID=I3EHL4_NEMP3|nr:hypothetical protein NEQG_01401 [Nematocida parisii ERTm3]